VNRDDLDFGSAADVPPVQANELVADSGGIEVDYPTKYSKMQNVSSISIYFSDNFGADATIVSFLGFKGESTHFRHGVVEAVYESKPQAADHKQPGGEFANNSVL
jgi:PITH domain